jgi:hypothetical protein
MARARETVVAAMHEKNLRQSEVPGRTKTERDHPTPKGLDYEILRLRDLKGVSI